MYLERFYFSMPHTLPPQLLNHYHYIKSYGMFSTQKYHFFNDPNLNDGQTYEFHTTDSDTT